MPKVTEIAASLAQCELPLFGDTVHRLLAATQDEARSMAEVGRLIGQDPALSSLVLRMANSASVNPRNQRILTLSRAVLVLGLEQIRILCYSALVLESTVHARFQDRVLGLLRQSLELGGQAQFLAEKANADGETYFLAGLLQYLGQIAFWCAGGPEAQALHELLEQGTDPEVATLRILGFSFEELDRALLDHWGLGLLGTPEPVANINIVKEAQLWTRLQAEGDTSALHRRIQKLEPLFRQKTPVLMRSLKEHREHTLALLPPRWLEARPEGKRLAQWTEVDSTLQLQVLSDLHGLPRTGAYLPVLLQAVLEGLHRGGGWDRCAFLVHQEGGWHPRLRIGPVSNLFPEKAIQVGGALQITAPLQLSVELQNEKTLPSLEAGPGGVSAPVQFQGKVIGVLYADRALSGRKPNPEARQAFDLFWRQLHLLLAGKP